MQNKKFLEHLSMVLNNLFQTDSFALTEDQLVHIYSPEFLVGVHSVVRDLDQFSQISMSDLFSAIEKVVNRLKNSDLEIIRLIIVSTNSEEDLITNFIQFLQEKQNIEATIEFWGWETIQNIFRQFPAPSTGKLQIGDKQNLNFVPTANIYMLFGIDGVLREIDEAVDSSLNPVVIYNPLPGTGKTAVLLAYAFHYDYQKKIDHYAFVSVTGNLKVDFVSAFDGYIGFAYSPLVNLDENLDLLLEMLNKVSGRNLLLIDGINGVEQSVELIRVSSKLKWKILVTSQFRIFSLKNIFLRYPDDQDAEKIFSYFFEDIEVDDTVKNLLDKVSYHPFMIVFMARFLSHYADSMSVNDLLAMLSEKDKSIYHLRDYIDTRLSKDKQVLVRNLLKYIMAIFDYQVYNFSALERQILLLASVLPDRFTTFSHLQEILGMEDNENFSDTVLTILSKGWLEADKDKFRVPLLVRSVLHKKFRPSPLNLKFYLSFLIQRLSLSTDKALQWLDYASTLVHNIVKLNIDVANLVLLLAHHYDNLGAEQDALANYEYAGYIIEQIYNETNDVELLEPLARIWDRVDRTERSVFYAETLLAELEREQDQSAQLVEWYQFVSQLYYKLDNYQKAISYADRAVDIATMLFGKDDLRLIEAQEYHQFLSQAYNESHQKSIKKQWLRRFFT